MKPGDRLITALVGEHHAGETFKEWLLHITVVAWFDSKLSSEEIATKLEARLMNIRPFQVTMATEERLGYKGRALVNVVQLPSPLMAINQRVADALEESGAHLLVNRGTWGGPFKPHVTAQRSARLNEGDQFWCDRLYVVSQQGGHKRIDAEVHLHG